MGGIYVFKKDALLDLLNEEMPGANDFGSEIIPCAAEKMNVQAYLFNDYWEDIGTMKSFFDANLALAHQPPPFEFYDPSAPIYTSSRNLPPAQIEKCHIRSRIGKGAQIKDALIMGADFYEDERERAQVVAD